MQNQEFDDRIRKQILSITKESEENEVEKIHRYVSLSKNKDLRPKKAFFFVYGIIAVILFGSISYIYLNTDTVPSSWVSAWFTAPASNSSSNHSKRIAYAQVGSSLPIPLVKSADRTAHIASKAEKALVDEAGQHLLWNLLPLLLQPLSLHLLLQLDLLAEVGVISLREYLFC